MDGDRLPDGRAPEPTLTTSEAAEVLGVSVATLRRWAAAGAIPSVRTPGGHRRFRRPELRRFVGAPITPSGIVWPDVLLDPRVSNMSLQAHVHHERELQGSWSSTSEQAIFPALLELYRRSEAGLITAVQRQEAFYRLECALIRFLDGAPVHTPHDVLVIGLPGERSFVPIIRVALCVAERGWACRCAGAVAPEELGPELERAAPSALVVCASLSVETRELERWGPAYARVAQERVPALFVGPWPVEPLGGAAHAGHGLGEINGWLDGLAARERS